MNALTGTLFALGLTALLLAAALIAPAASGTAFFPAILIVVGLGTFVASWTLLLARQGHLEAQLREAALRLEDWAADLQRARAALGDAERSIQAGVRPDEGAALLAEALSRLTADADDAVRAAYQGLATPSEPAPIDLDALVARAETLASAVAGRTITVEHAIEPHAAVMIDRERVASLLARVLLAAEGVVPPRLEVGEWQAGLLRVQVVSVHPPPPPGALIAGLNLAAAHARALGGSLDWSATATGSHYVLLLPLDAEDVRTDPGL